MTRLQSLRRTLLQLGALDGMLYCTHRALMALSGGRLRMHRYYLVAQPVASGGPSAGRKSLKTTVRLITADDPVVAQFPRPAEVLARRFEQRPSCFVAQSGECFIGFLWLAFDAYEEDEVRCRYELAAPERSAWDYDVYVEPAHRLGRCFARLWDAANAHLSERGIEWSMSRISAFNPDSLAAHRGFGVKKLFSATFLTLGSLQLMLSGAAPFVHFSAGEDARPTLRLALPERDASR